MGLQTCKQLSADFRHKQHSEDRVSGSSAEERLGLHLCPRSGAQRRVQDIHWPLSGLTDQQYEEPAVTGLGQGACNQCKAGAAPVKTSFADKVRERKGKRWEREETRERLRLSKEPSESVE